MTDVTRILNSIGDGDPKAAEELLPIVYEELRRLAAARMSHEKPGQTLQATALVHEAWLRLVGEAEPKRWDSQGHFFAAAAEAMRRLLVENARRKARLKRGGNRQRVDLEDVHLAIDSDPVHLLAINPDHPFLASWGHCQGDVTPVDGEDTFHPVPTIHRHAGL